MEVARSDIQKAVKYLEDAARLYDTLAALQIQKFTCRAHMIKQLSQKLKKLSENDKNRIR